MHTYILILLVEGSVLETSASRIVQVAYYFKIDFKNAFTFFSNPVDRLLLICASDNVFGKKRRFLTGYTILPCRFAQTKENAPVKMGLTIPQPAQKVKTCLLFVKLKISVQNKHCFYMRIVYRSLTPRVKPWLIQSVLTFDSMNRTLKCDHSLESC